VPTALTPLEAALIEDLRAGTDLNRAAATLAIVMLSRRYARPKEELIHLLRRYPALEDVKATDTAMRELFARGWLQEAAESELSMVRATPRLESGIRGAVTKGELAASLSSLRPQPHHRLAVVGALTDDHVYHSLLRELEEAQREILLWMLATSPQISAVPVLQDRARAGVKVRLLLGSEQAVASLRGGSSAAMARTAIEGWKANTKGFEHMDLRLSDAPEDAYLAGSMLIDDTLLRIDVYDPLHERGMDGVMLEARSPTTLDLNLVWLYRESFEAAWNRGLRPSRWGRFTRRLQRPWRFWLAGTSTGLAFAPFGSAWRQIMYGVAATGLSLGLIEHWPAGSLRRGWRRLRTRNGS
jgi:hypothetical protein